MPAEDANALFQVISSAPCTARSSSPPTAASPTEDTSSTTPTIAAALLDRPLHRCVPIAIDGESYRLQAHQALQAHTDTLRKGDRH